MRVKNMIIKYVIPLTKELYMPNHWPVPIMDGALKMISDDDVVKSIEITFKNQPVQLAPQGQCSGQIIHIYNKDSILPDLIYPLCLFANSTTNRRLCNTSFSFACLFPFCAFLASICSSLRESTAYF